jgi:signal transduction histidine kinase/ligand-binding sensor protein
MMNDSKVYASCPNCATDFKAKYNSIIKCENPNCNYTIRIFDKENEKIAEDFYLLTPSKQIKFRQITSNGNIIIAYCEEVKIYTVDNIFDLIDPEALQTIQVGLSQRLKIPMSIYVYLNENSKFRNANKSIEIIDYDGNYFGRINPLLPNAYHCNWCKIIRGTEIGEKRCTQYDCEITFKIFKSSSTNSIISTCWSGLIDFAIPVVINNKVVAVFTCGQIKLVNEDSNKIRYDKEKSIIQELGIPINELKKEFDEEGQYIATNTDEIESILIKYEEQVKLICGIAENRYWALRDLNESDFMSEIYSSFAVLNDSKRIWDVIKMVLDRINEFANFKYSTFFINEEANNRVFRLKANSSNVKAPSDFITFDDKIMREYFKTESLVIIDEKNVLENKDICNILCKYLNITNINSLVIFTFKLDEYIKGFLFFADRVGSSNTGMISEKRRSFMEKLCHEIRIEVFNALNLMKLQNTIIDLNNQKEKIEKAEKIREHETKAPLASIIANANFVLRNLNEVAATSKNRRLKEIISDTEICSFLFKEIKIPSKEEFQKSLINVSSGSIINDVVRYIEREVERRSKMSINKTKNQIEHEFEMFPCINIVTLGSTSRSAIHPYLLKRAFYNLCINAVKYSAPKDGELKIYMSEKNGNIYFVFEDNGIGINEEDAPYIFNDGFRGKNVRNKYHGEGIGLKIARDIIEAHSGTISLRNMNNPTVFEIFIPHKMISIDNSFSDHHIIRKDKFVKY